MREHQLKPITYVHAHTRTTAQKDTKRRERKHQLQWCFLLLLRAEAAAAVDCYHKCVMGGLFSSFSFSCLDVKWETSGEREKREQTKRVQ